MDLRTRDRWRWVLWVTLAGGFLLVNFHRVSTAVLADSLNRAFDTNAAELGLLHASFFYIYAPLQLPAGVLADRAGTRRVAAAGVAVMSLGVVWFALADSLSGAFVGRALVGLGGSVCYIAILRFCANWFRGDQFATMTGWTVAAAGLGGVLATTPLALAVGAVGWRPSLLVTAAVGGVVAAVTYVLVRDTPETAGFDPVEGATPPQRSVDLSTVWTNVERVLRDRETWILGVILFFVIGTNFTVLGLWGVPFVADVYGTSVATASTYVLLGNVGLLLGPPVLGTLSDRLGRQTEVILGATVLFTLAYGTVFVFVTPPLPLFGVLLFLAMFTTGGTMLSYTVAKDRHAASASGTVTGSINSLGYLGAAVFPAVMGVVLDAYWTGRTLDGARVYTVGGYRVAFGLATVAGVVAIGCATYLHVRTSTGTNARAVTAND